MNIPISQQGVQSSTLNVGASAPFGQKPIATNTISPLRLSVSQLTTFRWKLAEELLQAKQIGYQAIGLYRPKLVEYGESRLIEMVQRSKLNVSSLSFAGGFTGGCGFSYLEAIDDGHEAIRQARAIGAKNVIMVGGSRNGHTNRHSRRMVVDALRELGHAAVEGQIQLSVMPMHSSFSHNWTFLNSLDQALDLIEEVNHQQVYLAFDTYHLSAETRLLDRIPQIAKRTGIVQLSDSERPFSSGFERLTQAERRPPLTDLVRAFQVAGYAGYFDIQAWSSNVSKQNYSHLTEQRHAMVKAMSVQAVAGSLNYCDND